MRDYADHGQHLGPLPTPGVFARHNAVDTPALLPDGTAGGVVGLARARGPWHGALALRPWPTTSPASRQQLGEAPHAGRDQSAPATTEEEAPDDMTPYVVLSAILFTIGCVGVLTRRNAIVVFMCVELMLNASNLALVAFASSNGNLDGQVAAFFVMVVAAAEVVVGLAIIMTIFRTRRSASVDDASLLKY